MTVAGGSSGHVPGRQSSLWRNRSYRRFFAGQFVTNAGDSLYTVAVLWLVFSLTGSTVLTGVANALLLLPWLLQVVAGPVVDRCSLKRLLVGAQVTQGVAVLAVPVAAATGHLSVPLVLLVVPVLSLMTLLLSPVQTALLPRILPPDQLSRGNAALAAVSLGLDTVFEAVGGLLVAAVGTMALFTSDALTFAASALLFGGMTVPSATDEAAAGGERESVDAAVREYLADLRAGIDVLRGTVFVDAMLAAAVANVAVGVTLAILPAFGALRGGPATYGLLLAALGVGRTVGSATASRLDHLPFGRLLAVSYAAGAILWAASVYAPSRVLLVCLFGLAWIPGGLDGVLTETVNQRVFPDGMLGRVSAIKGTATTATLPLGSLVGGVVAGLLGVTTTMTLAAAGFGFVGVYFALRSPLRGLPAASEVTPADFDVELPGTGGE